MMRRQRLQEEEEIKFPKDSVVMHVFRKDELASDIFLLYRIYGLYSIKMSIYL